jgi:2-(1,2-epoxy-1,2-dihydrophenyl)acetyl-CoA isomerase
MSDTLTPPTPQILTATAAAVTTITLNAPSKLNSFTREMHVQLLAALDSASADPAVRCVVITGAGRGFCAGQDLVDLDLKPGQPPTLGNLVADYFNPLIRRLNAFPKPIVMAVNGIAAGAGANLAQAGDLCIAKQSAHFVQAFVNIGLLPDSGGTYFLPRNVGTARAMGLAMLGGKLSATDAAAAGMIWQAVADEAFEATVQASASKLAALPTLALLAIRQAMRHGGSLDAQLDLEDTLQTQLAGTQDFNEGVNAFLAKRPAQFKGC